MALIDMNMNVLKEYSNLIDAICSMAQLILPKGSRVVLFGSRARGDAREDSDWDLQILVPGPEKLPLSQVRDYAWPFDALGIKHGEMINPRVYSYRGWENRSFMPFYKNVTNDGIIIFEN
ncbi:MAG: nucleotidyltransferase domain-containing protein [Muribaculaceae bacterium]|nr:nucleotidyltransferase domain-containing protein [Muribaculaceae bacterium]